MIGEDIRTILKDKNCIIERIPPYISYYGDILFPPEWVSCIGTNNELLQYGISNIGYIKKVNGMYKNIVLISKVKGAFLWVTTTQLGLII